MLIALGIWIFILPELSVNLSTPDQEFHFDDSVSTASRVVQRGVIRVGVKYDTAPFGFTDENGEIIGFDIDLAREFAQRWLGDANAVKLVRVTSADRIPRLTAGDIDIILAALPVQRERDALVDFSQTYFIGGQGLLVGAASPIQNLTELQNRQVGTIQDSIWASNLQDAANQSGVAIQIAEYQDYTSAVEALLGGQVEAITADSVTLTQITRANSGLRLLHQRVNAEPYGIGVRQGDSAFRQMVDLTLQDMKHDGTYDRIYRNWFTGDTPHDLLVAMGEQAYTLEELPAELTYPQKNLNQQIQERGRLVVGIQPDLEPLSVIGEEGQPIGFDIDIVQEFARRWLGDTDAIELIPFDTEDLTTEGIQNYDLLTGLIYQREYAMSIGFSQAYLGPPLAGASYHLGLPLTEAHFRELVNVTLQEMKVDGTYDRFYQRWFGINAPTFALEILPGVADYLQVPYREQDAGPRGSRNQVSIVRRIRQRGNRMIVGVRLDRPPFSYQNASGELTGFDIDILRAIAREWNVQLDLVEVTPFDYIDKLVTGNIDMVATALPHNRQEEGRIEFSETYFVDGQGLMTQAAAQIDTLYELDQGNVGVFQGSAALEQIEAFAEANALAIELLVFGDYASALEALNQGQLDALSASNLILSQLDQENDDLVVTDILFDQTVYSLGMPLGDSNFRHLVNSTLLSFQQNGKYQEIYERWFGQQENGAMLGTWSGSWPYTLADSPDEGDPTTGSRIDNILTDGRLVAGVMFDMAPFGMLDENNQLVGFEIDLIKAFAKRWIGDEGRVEFIPVTVADRIQKLSAGEVDLIAASLPRHYQYADEVRFSQAYFQDHHGLLVRANSDINNLQANLTGRFIKIVQDGLLNDNILIPEGEPFQEYPQALQSLKAGQVDALVGSVATLGAFARQDANVRLLNQQVMTLFYGFGVPYYDNRFQDLINFTLQEMKLDGTYDRIYRTWFETEEPFPVETWSGDNYLGLDLIPMIKVPAGQFTRGNDTDGLPDEKPSRTIYLDEFYIDQYEVTNRQYAQCVRAGKCTLPRLPRSVNFTRYYAESSFRNSPVTWVNWQDAVNYCAFAGKRLPTEAEWEKAARGPENTFYPWGNQAQAEQANFSNQKVDALAVGSYSAGVSGYGVHDMAGNVREWVSDWYQWNYYSAEIDQNPQGPEKGVTKVLRGGGWNDTALYVKSTVRKNFLPDSIDSNLGFRCASTVFPPTR